MKLKKLNLADIWKLYLLLKPALDGREIEPIFINEIDKLLAISKPGTLVDCLDVLYDNKDVKSGAEALTLFIDGLIKNEFYEFVETIRMFSK